MKLIKKLSIPLLSVILGIGLLLPLNGASANTNVQTTNDTPVALQPIDISNIQHSVNMNLTEEQIKDRFELITSSYEIGQPFSEEDTEFVRAYATLVNSDEKNLSGSNIGINDFKFGNSASSKFSKSKTAQGVSVTYSGTVRAKLGFVNHSYGGNVTAKINSGSSKITSIQTVVKGSAFGLLGNSGTYVGLVHSGSVSSTSGAKATSWKMDKTKEYSAVAVVYVYVNAYTVINTTTGSFDLYAF